MNLAQDFQGYSVVMAGDNAGRYATSEVAVEAYYDELCSIISDASKDACGIRIRNDRSQMSFAELEEELAHWCKRAQEAYEEEQEREAELVEEFKALIQTTIELGAGDEETALRWLTQDNQFYHSQDVEHWVWQQGILFTDYGKELVKRLLDIVQYEVEEAA